MKTKRFQILYFLTIVLFLPCLILSAVAAEGSSTAMTLEDVHTAYNFSDAETISSSNTESFSIAYTANGKDFTTYKSSDLDSFYENETWYVKYDQLGERMVRFDIGGDFYEFNNGLVRISIPMNAQDTTAFIMNDSESLTARITCDTHIIFKNETMYVPIEYILTGIENCRYLDEGKLLYVELITDIDVLFDRYGIENPYTREKAYEKDDANALETPSDLKDTEKIGLVFSKITANTMACTVNTALSAMDATVTMSITDGNTEIFFQVLDPGVTDIECNELVSNTAYKIAFTNINTGQLMEQCGFSLRFLAL